MRCRCLDLRGVPCELPGRPCSDLIPRCVLHRDVDAANTSAPCSVPHRARAVLGELAVDIYAIQQWCDHLDTQLSRHVSGDPGSHAAKASNACSRVAKHLGELVDDLLADAIDHPNQ